MIPSETNFPSFVRQSLARAEVFERIGLATAGTVVLERIARGAGATRWYLCRSAEALREIEERFSPGSVVSFYFDQRIKEAPMSATVIGDIERIIAETGDAVAGTVEADGINIAAEIIVSSDDLQDFLSSIAVGTRLFYGAFPSRENDGTRAITITLPDQDGIVRAHPH